MARIVTLSGAWQEVENKLHIAQRKVYGMQSWQLQALSDAATGSLLQTGLEIGQLKQIMTSQGG